MTDDQAQNKLMRRAIALLARRSHATAELRRKLSRNAVPEVLDQVLQSLEALGLLNDAEYAYNLALRRISQDGWGPTRVRGYLLSRGVAPSASAAAVDRVLGEVDAAAAMDGYLRSRIRRHGLPADWKGVRRLFQHLQRRGYRDHEIRAALSRVVPPSAWRAFDTGE